MSTITYSNNEFPVPTFHCSECGKSTEGFSICLNCTPQTYEVHKISSPIGACACLGPQNGDPLCPCEMRNIYDKGWNEAIEAVIDELDKIGHSTDKDIYRIRKLRK